METKIIYKKIAVTDRLPKSNGIYKCVHNGEDHNRAFDLEDGFWTVTGVTHWYEKQEPLNQSLNS